MKFCIVSSDMWSYMFNDFILFFTGGVGGLAATRIGFVTRNGALCDVKIYVFFVLFFIFFLNVCNGTVNLSGAWRHY